MSETQISADTAAHLLHEALEQLGWQADPETVAARVTRLRFGLPAEDEFSVLLSWLGRCRLVHKLDQVQVPPEAHERFQVPDLLAILTVDGREQAVLIEVKSKADPKLSWKPKYLEGLQRYGDAVGLPVLVAWKFLGLWSLFELRHFKLARTNYNVSLATAVQQNLLSLLCGDFVYVLQSGVGLHLRLKKEERVAVLEDDADGRTETWHLRIDEAYFTNGDGERTSRVGPGIWPLLLASPLEDELVDTEGAFVHRFVIPPEEPAQWAHRSLVSLLEFLKPGSAPIRWRDVLERHTLPTSAPDLRKAVSLGMQSGFVRRAFDQRPLDIPAFASPSPAPRRH